MVNQQPEVLAVEPALLGEGPLWLPESKQLVWVDIEGKCIHMLSPGTGAQRVIMVGERISAIVPAEDGRLVCALQSGFYFLDLQKEGLEWIADPESDQPGNRFNDGKCDPAGRFWAGTMPLEGNEPVGSLYRLDQDGSVRRMLSEVRCSNGLAWNPDAAAMYFIDTYTRRIDRFDYDARTGSIGNRRAVVHIPPEQGLPDGMTIDAEGMLWVAFWGGSCVARLNPGSGEWLQRVELPVSQVTSCCFGGDGLEELYITSARTGLSEEQLQKEPLAGSVFRCIPGVRGLPANVYKLQA
ncbi:SMP-30/gluconolactonase/LRE family protein [Paenibacillus puldeungensis]|uniref:SMP-30/gluconolactonase/LRE family protein n=1 Tax=Paenibacillus puldeungensis TaxID=696536 RepID=A0ABW3RR07_9BACL